MSAPPIPALPPVAAPPAPTPPIAEVPPVAAPAAAVPAVALPPDDEAAPPTAATPPAADAPPRVAVLPPVPAPVGLPPLGSDGEPWLPLLPQPNMTLMPDAASSKAQKFVFPT